MLGRLLALSLLVGAPAASGADLRPTVFEHPQEGLWVGGQMNVILQAKPPFPALYTGGNSLLPTGEAAVSFVGTFFSAIQLARYTEAVVHVEMAAGGGLSSALGLAGFTNLDVVRNPTLGAEPYLARALLRQTVPLSEEQVELTPGPFTSARSAPAQRLELRLGKLSTVDVFDTNAWGSDSHLGFMNWTVDNNGAYDYAADTRGYTYGLIVEYVGPNVSVRFGELLMPTVANGLQLDFDLSRSRAENLEVELRYHLGKRAGTVRLLGYLNHANMGSYQEAIDAFLAGQDAVPDIEAHRAQGRLKGGVGLNFEQELAQDVVLFGRAGWNEGAHESFAYTEVNDTVALGLGVDGALWHREGDRLGLALVTNGLSPAHREYLALGGKGFLLGDGALRYGREAIAELFFTAQLWNGLFAAADLQGILDPGYNRDRGPVLVGSLRVHADF